MTFTSLNNEQQILYKSILSSMKKIISEDLASVSPTICKHKFIIDKINRLNINHLQMEGNYLYKEFIDIHLDEIKIGTNPHCINCNLHYKNIINNIISYYDYLINGNHIDKSIKYVDFFEGKNKEFEGLVMDQKTINLNKVQYILSFIKKDINELLDIKYNSNVVISRLNEPLYYFPNIMVSLYYHIHNDDKFNLFDLINVRDNLITDFIIHHRSLKFISQQLGINLNRSSYTHSLDSIPNLINNKSFFDVSTIDFDIFDEFFNNIMKFELMSSNKEDYQDIMSFKAKVNKFNLPRLDDLYFILSKYRQIRLLKKNIQDINKIDISPLGIDYIPLSNGSYIITNKDKEFIIFEHMKLFTIWVGRDRRIYTMDFSHMNYLFTTLETIINMQLIVYNNEYPYFTRIFSNYELIVKDTEHTHEAKVKFFKIFESICLMKADILESSKVSWFPIIDVIESLNMSTVGIMTVMLGLNIYRAKSIFEKTIVSLNELDPIKLIELSTTHKFIYYSEVDEDKGIRKYFSRTFTKRKFNESELINLKYIFRKLLILNYYHKHKELPQLKGDNSVIELIKHYLKYEKVDDYMALDLHQFTSIEFLETFELNNDKNPILYAKDKGCSKSDILFKPGDSIPELLDLLTTQEYELSEDILHDIHYKNLSMSMGTVGNLRSTVYKKFATRLCMKEREQKLEGRLFGCATMKNKHNLSYINLIFENVLKYFPNQYLIIPDSLKQSNMNDAGQLLNCPYNYSLLLDIEGHNQSMQYENMLPVIEEISKLYNLPSLNNIANYFRILDVYYYNQYINKAYYMRGQFGGIEGWMNGLWTLVTLLVTELLHYKTRINVKKILLYSDDVNVIFENKDLTNREINDIYQSVQDHYLNYGFLVKSSQTIISKYRSTLLRVHYYKGNKVDISLKKLLSISSNTETTFINESIDAQSLNSSIDSALEHNNKIMTPMYIKWFKLYHLSKVNFINLLMKGKNTLRLGKLYNPELRSILGTHNNHNLILELYLNNKTNITAEKLINMTHYNGKQITAKSILIKVEGNNLVRSILLNKQLLFIWYLRIVLPEELHGYGVGTLQNNILIGHSNPLIKLLTQLQTIINSTLIEPQYRDIIKLFINRQFYTDNTSNTSNIIESEFPIFNKALTSKQIIETHLVKKIEKITINSQILKLQEFSKQSKSYKDRLIAMSKDNFNFRIMNYYYKECSIIKCYDIVMSKIENSRNFMKRLHLGEAVSNKLINNNTQQLFDLFIKIDNHCYHDIISSNNSDILGNMKNYRKSLYNNIRFNNITEPVYDNDIVEVQNINFADCVIKQSCDYYIKGDMKYKKFKEVPTKIKIKYTEEDRAKQYTKMEYKMIVDNLFITKWILANDEVTYSDNINYVQICNFNLSALCEYKYKDMSDLIDLPLGGEILHRLPNVRFKAKSYIRSLDNYAVRHDVNVVAHSLLLNKYKDSNVNINYLKNLIRYKCCIRESIFGKSTAIAYYKLTYNENIIEDVGVTFSYYRTLDNLSQGNYRLFKINNLNIDNLLVYNRLNSLDELLDFNKRVPGLIKLTLADFIIKYYNSFSHNYLWVNTPMSNNDPWQSAFETLRLQFLELSELQFKDFMFMVKDTIKEYYKVKQYPKELNHDIIKDVIELIDDEMDCTLDMIRYRELSNNLFDNLITIIGRVHNRDSREFDALNEIEVNQMKYNDNEKLLLKDNLVYKSLMIFLYKHCLYLDFFKGKYIINNDISFNLLIEKLNDAYLQVYLDPECIILRYFNVQKNPMIVLDYKERLMLKLNNLYQRVLPMLETYEEVCLLNSKHLETVREFPSELLNSINYQGFNIDIAFIERLSRVKHVLNQLRNLQFIYSHPDSFYSVTGSDSFTALLGLGKYLKLNYGNSKIIDLTGGRGDGLVAFDHVKLNSDSYMRSDTFTKLLSHKDMIKAEYNVTDPTFSNLSFTMVYDIIVIDISHISGPIDNLFNNIKNWVINDKVVVVRLNSLNMSLLALFLMNNRSSISAKIIGNISKHLQPYQIYIEFTKGSILSNTNYKESIPLNYIFNNVAEVFKNEDNMYAKLSRNAVTSISLKLISDKVEAIDVKDLVLNYKKYNMYNKLNKIRSTIDKFFEAKAPLLIYGNHELVYSNRTSMLNTFKSICGDNFTTCQSALDKKDISIITLSDFLKFNCNINDLFTPSRPSYYNEIVEFIKDLKLRYPTIDSLAKYDLIMAQLKEESSVHPTDSIYYEATILKLFGILNDSYKHILNSLLALHAYGKNKSRYLGLIKCIRLSSNDDILLSNKLSETSLEDKLEIRSISKDLLNLNPINLQWNKNMNELHKLMRDSIRNELTVGDTGGNLLQLNLFFNPNNGPITNSTTRMRTNLNNNIDRINSSMRSNTTLTNVNRDDNHNDIQDINHKYEDKGDDIAHSDSEEVFENLESDNGVMEDDEVNGVTDNLIKGDDIELDSEFERDCEEDEEWLD